MCKINQTNSILTAAVVVGHFLEADTRSSASGLGQLSDVGDFDRKELRGRVFRRRRSTSLQRNMASNAGPPQLAAVCQLVLQAF